MKITMQDRHLYWPPYCFLDPAMPPAHFFHSRIAIDSSTWLCEVPIVQVKNIFDGKQFFFLENHNFWDEIEKQTRDWLLSNRKRDLVRRWLFTVEVNYKKKIAMFWYSAQQDRAIIYFLPLMNRNFGVEYWDCLRMSLASGYESRSF